MLRCLTILLTLAGLSQAFDHFEPRQVHPVTLTPDGTRLLALHSTAHQLSLFDLGSPPRHAPLLVAEIPVSTAPVSVRARNNDEAWVVNEVSDSVSVVSLSRQTVIDTLRVADEPADVAFAAGKAFVSCARARSVEVFDAESREHLASIPIEAVKPSALAVSPDGSTVYLAALHSGNGTTILPRAEAPAPPEPTNPDLPPAPPTSLIVPADDPRIDHVVLDHDIAEIDTDTLSVRRWFSGVGTHLFDLAVAPDGSVLCANSESLNLTRFEPQLNGDFSRHRITRLNPEDGSLVHHDLNHGIARATEPDQESRAIALAQPTALVLEPGGGHAWVAAFNSDRVARVDLASGEILRRVDLRPQGFDSRAMRGPRAAVLNGDASRLYVLNKISDTLGTIETGSGAWLSEVPLGSTDPMPPAIREGRGVLYDARLSGNGMVSCATCHLDAGRDGLAWDLGDPGGEMLGIPSANLSVHDFTVFDRTLHPMKGPLTTQTLRGLSLNDARRNDPTTGAARPEEPVVTKFHWRGDKPTIQSFNSTFPNLMGGEELPDAQMDRLSDYLLSIRLHPNPNRDPDRGLADDLDGGDPARGLTIFNDHALSHCIVCHDFNAGTDQNLDDFASVGSSQPMKNPGFRQLYTRAGIYDPNGTSLAGFGLGSDGSGHELPIVHPYGLDLLDRLPMTPAKRQNLADLTAFLLSFDTGTAPAEGLDRTITADNRGAATSGAHLELLETQASRGWAGLAAWGRIDGESRRFRFDPDTGSYHVDRSGAEPLTRAELLDLLGEGDALTVSGVPLSELASRSGDRNQNGITDRDEEAPRPVLEWLDGELVLRWSGARDWFPASAPGLPASDWIPARGEIRHETLESHFVLPADRPARRFFRLHRTW